MTINSLYLFAFCALFCVNVVSAQDNSAVQWQYQVDYTSTNEATLKFIAIVADGWHLYSQHITNGGPVPTHFSFEPTNDYVLLGQTQEHGHVVKFYDDTYEMDIAWYTDVVTFEQKIKMTSLSTHIKGTVEYMTCNDHTCVPNKQDFNMGVSPLKKKP